MGSLVFAERSRVIVLYTNDVHTHIGNMVKDADGNKVPGLTYASVAALKKDLASSGENVILVDDGDFSQGAIYGSEDKGRTVVSLMNEAGYDAATLGNHDFDFGMAETMNYIRSARFSIVSCNFFKGKKPVAKPYVLVQAGDAKVAFIGISTPETIAKSSPFNFMDKKHRSVIYDFAGDLTGDESRGSVGGRILLLHE